MISSDDLNPIFVLKMQRVLNFAQTHWMKLVLCYIIMIILVSVLCFPYSSMDFQWFWYGVEMCGVVTALVPSVELVYKQIHGDLSHFTPLSQRQLVTGYALTGIVYSAGTIWFLGFPFLVVFLQADILDANEFLLECTTLFQTTIYMALLSLLALSFCSGAKSLVSLGVTLILVYFLYKMLLDNFYVAVFMPEPVFYFDAEKNYVIPTVICCALGVPGFAWTAYSLAILNRAPDTSFVLKHIFFFMIYVVMLMILGTFFYLIYAFYDGFF